MFFDRHIASVIARQKQGWSKANTSVINFAIFKTIYYVETIMGFFFNNEFDMWP